MKVQSSHCKQLCFLLLAASKRWHGNHHPIQGVTQIFSCHLSGQQGSWVCILWFPLTTGRKLLSGALTPLHVKQRGPPTGVAVRLLLLACAGLVSAQASGQVLTSSVIHWIVAYWRRCPLALCSSPGYAIFHSPWHRSSLCSIQKKQHLSNGLSVLNGTSYWF